MQEQRGLWIDAKADNYLDHHGDELFLEHAIMTKDKLPEHGKLWNYDGESKWYDDSCPKKFTGDTYVDGSCIPCHQCADLGRAGAGIICVEDAPHDLDTITSETPDNPAQKSCTCINSGR